MPKSLRIFAAALVAVTGLWAGSTANKAASIEPITYTKHVAPVLYKNCTTCHRPGEIAPMSLMSYQDVRPWAKSIREKVSGRVMPPWHADARYGKFDNDRSLAAKDIATLVAWVDGGMREGDPKDMPPAPTYVDGWNIGKPDAVFSLPELQQVPAQGVVEYQHIAVPTNFTEDHWIQAGEIRPGNRAVVHHVIVFVQDPEGSPRPPTGFQMRVPAPQARPPLATAAAAAARPQRQRGNWGWFLVGSGAGEQATFFPPGTAKLVKAGSKLTFQMHYTPNGAATTDRTSVGLIFAKQPPEYDVRTAMVANGRFVIPAGEANYRVDSVAEFTEDTILWGLFPHMHLRGKTFEYRLVYPDGHSETILNVPKYDFGWQSGYSFAQPINVPKGARLECTAYFDNSRGNHFNPDPTQEVRWGDQTWEEMMIGWMSYSVQSQRITRIASK